MHTPTHNAAREAVQAEPCLHAAGTDTSNCTCALGQGAGMPALQTAAILAAAHLVLLAEGDTESLRTVVRAYRAVEALIGHMDHQNATVSSDGLAALLGTLNDAMSQRLAALVTKVDAVRDAVRSAPLRGPRMKDKTGHLAFEACDQAESLTTVSDAYGAVQDLAPYSEHASGAGLSAALQLLNDAMSERLATMDDRLDELHAAMVSNKAGAA